MINTGTYEGLRGQKLKVAGFLFGLTRMFEHCGDVCTVMTVLRATKLSAVNRWVAQYVN